MACRICGQVGKHDLSCPMAEIEKKKLAESQAEKQRIKVQESKVETQKLSTALNELSTRKKDALNKFIRTQIEPILAEYFREIKKEQQSLAKLHIDLTDSLTIVAEKEVQLRKKTFDLYGMFEEFKTELGSACLAYFTTKEWENITAGLDKPIDMKEEEEFLAWWKKSEAIPLMRMLTDIFERFRTNPYTSEVTIIGTRNKEKGGVEFDFEYTFGRLPTKEEEAEFKERRAREKPEKEDGEQKEGSENGNT